MARMKNNGEFGGSASLRGEITAETYAKQALAYCQRSGRENGAHPVVRRGERAWVEWMGYFTHLGHPHADAGSVANRQGVLTVPCLDPNDFDGGWRAKDPGPGSGGASRKAYVEDRENTPEQRERMKLAFDKLLDDMKRGRLRQDNQGWTDEQLADWNCVINGQGHPYVTRRVPIPRGYPGAGKTSEYGYLTPAEIAAKRNAGQIAPRSYHEAAE